MMEPQEERSATPQVEIVWLLIELKVEGEDDMVPVTMPVPILKTATLEMVRAEYAHERRMVEARIATLYSEEWLAGRQWSVYGDRVITATAARRMFPDDPFKAGRIVGGNLRWHPEEVNDE